MKPLFYDNGATGHHPAYVSGIAEAALQTDTDSMFATVTEPTPLLGGNRWIEVGDHDLRSVRANRREVARAAEIAAKGGCDVLVDLYLDKMIWAADAATSLRRQAHVLHHGEQYDGDTRRGFAALRTRYLRRRLQRMTAQGAVVVVHNTRTASLLTGVVPEDRLLIAGYPVRPLPSTRRVPDSNPTLLFVGAGRREKGLDLLIAALGRNPGMAGLKVVGKQPVGLRSRMSAEHPEARIDWQDRFVGDDELYDAYATSHLAVLPYRAEFGRHGGPSSVLLETLSSGIPIVTTTALAEQLPSEYGGAVIAASDSVESLSDALELAMADLGAMSIEAASQGPLFVAEHHSYDAYLATLLDAARLAANRSP